MSGEKAVAAYKAAVRQRAQAAAVYLFDISRAEQLLRGIYGFLRMEAGDMRLLFFFCKESLLLDTGLSECHAFDRKSFARIFLVFPLSPCFSVALEYNKYVS